MHCCQVTLLILLCLIIGFCIGIFITEQYDINGFKDLWDKFASLFKQEKKVVIPAPLISADTDRIRIFS